MAPPTRSISDGARRIVRADGASRGLALVRCVVTVLRARPIIPVTRKQRPLARVRHLAGARLSYAARAAIERVSGIAKRHCGLDTAEAVGWAPVLLRVTLPVCAILVVALAAHRAGAPDLRLSPTRVLAHYLPVQEVA